MHALCLLTSSSAHLLMERAASQFPAVSSDVQEASLGNDGGGAGGREKRAFKSQPSWEKIIKNVLSNSGALM